MTVVLAVGIMMLLAVFLGLRVLFGKDEEVRKPGCSNANAFMDQQEACPVCGITPGQNCANEARRGNRHGRPWREATAAPAR